MAGIFQDNDFVFVSDNVNCWVMRAADISVLEACGNYTRVYFSDSSALIRRPLENVSAGWTPPRSSAPGAIVWSISAA